MQTPHRLDTTRRVRAGFTLLEVVLVMVIIGVLATVAALNLTSGADRARENASRASMKTIEHALKEHYFERGAYPTTAEGITILVQTKKLDTLPLDGWKRPFAYYSPIPNAPSADKDYTIICLGKDAIEGTADDITIWDIK